MHSTPPNAPQPSTPYRPMTTPMAFEWRPCPRHPWLGVSALVVRGGVGARCYLPDGSSHPVEVETAAAA